jgi:GTP-binding protein
VLLDNKADKKRRAAAEDYQALGIKQIFLTSTSQNRGIDALLDNLVTQVQTVKTPKTEATINLAILGRPNVGKSQLFNSLAKKQQAIVANRAGTTRDINRVTIRYEGKPIELMDTAGIRRSGKIERGVERFSVLRSLSAIEQADIALVLIDINEPMVQLDQKIAGMVKEAGKGLILVISKWDSLEDKTPFSRDQIAPQIAHDFEFVPWAPLIFTSAVTGQNVTKIFDLVLQIQTERAKRLKTTELNRWLKQVVDKHPPAGLKNRQPKLNYMVQEEDNPTPSFKIFGSQTKFLHWSYKRYLERELREAFGFEGTSVQLWFIEKH